MFSLNKENKSDIFEIKENVVLTEKSSMHVGGSAEYFSEIYSIEALKNVLNFSKKEKQKIFILGEGSNTLFSDKGFDGLVIRMNILGIDKINESEGMVEIEVGAGVHWDDLVKYSVDNEYYGIENMSHVPGSVGASVVQNIGCYGQEVSETVTSVKVVNVNNLEEEKFTNEELSFGYRKSRFNDEMLDKGKYIVTSVVYQLKKHGQVNSNYGDVQKYFKENNIAQPNLQTMREALIKIRNKKFPYPDKSENGTCGSFFNADTVNEDVYNNIIAKLNDKGFADKAEYLVKMKDSFKVSQGYKVPYGVLIESLGYKGRVNGGAKILESHAGVINNFTGQASAQEVYELAQDVIMAVFKEYEVRLKIEPELVGDFGRV